MPAGRPDSFLLETDSPHLDKHERPWMAYVNGVKAAKIMGIPTMELVRVCNKMLPRCIACLGKDTLISLINNLDLVPLYMKFALNGYIVFLWQGSHMFTSWER